MRVAFRYDERDDAVHFARQAGRRGHCLDGPQRRTALFGRHHGDDDGAQVVRAQSAGAQPGGQARVAPGVGTDEVAEKFTAHMVFGVEDRVLFQGEERGDLCGALDGPLLHRAEFDRAVTDEKAAEHHFPGEYGDRGVELSGRRVQRSAASGAQAVRDRRSDGGRVDHRGGAPVIRCGEHGVALVEDDHGPILRRSNIAALLAAGTAFADLSEERIRALREAGVV